MLAVDGVPLGVLKTGVDRVPALDQVGIDLLNGSTGDETETGVAGRGHQVVLLGAGHQSHHLVRCARDLVLDHAAGVFFELGHPVEGGVGVAPLDVARPGDDDDASLAITDLGGQLCALFLAS